MDIDAVAVEDGETERMRDGEKKTMLATHSAPRSSAARSRSFPFSLSLILSVSPSLPESEIDVNHS
jgi:hypothetical protein